MSQPVNEMLYAADLSPGCEEALAHAIRLGKQLGAKLRVVTVIEDERETSVVEVDSYVPQGALDQYHDDHARRVKARLEAQVAAFSAERPDLNIGKTVSQIKVREGDDIAQLILAEAQAAPTDMIVLGSTSNENPILGFLFGSVVQDVTRRSAVPVLIVPVRE
jgi:nucleotide-binding universal stress UspA family protein